MGEQRVGKRVEQRLVYPMDQPWSTARTSHHRPGGIAPPALSENSLDGEMSTIRKAFKIMYNRAHSDRTCSRNFWSDHAKLKRQGWVPKQGGGRTNHFLKGIS